MSDLKLIRARLRVFLNDIVFESVEDVFAKFKEVLAPTARLFIYTDKRLPDEDRQAYLDRASVNRMFKDAASADYNCVQHLSVCGETQFHLNVPGHDFVTARVRGEQFWLDEDEPWFGR